MKKYLLFLSMAVISVWSMAQDTIMRTNRDIINAKVEEVGTDVIRYRKSSNIAGPIYNIATSDVAYIIYSNGSRDEFNAFIEDDTLLPPIIIEEEIAGKAVIAMLNGTEIAAIVEEVGIDKIRYRKVDNPTGPVYAVNVSEVFYILYDNGIRDDFNKPDATDATMIQKSINVDPEAEIPKAELTNTVTLEANPVAPSEELKMEEVVKKREPIFGVGFYYGKPIGPVTTCALADNVWWLSVAEHEEKYGEVKRNGYGMWGEANIFKGFRLLFDMSYYNMEDVYAEPGDFLTSGWAYNNSLFIGPDIQEPATGEYGMVYLSEGLIYGQRTTGFRFAGKYLLGNKSIKPFASLGYGFYQIQINYYTSDKEGSYGDWSGTDGELYYAVGLEFQIPDVANLVLFFENNGPDYAEEIEDLFYPDWDVSPGTLGPQNSMGAARIGVGISMF